MAKTIKGWWFSKGYELSHGDGRQIAIGVTHRVGGEIIPCKHGLHSSERIIDALAHAPGPVVWRTESSGIIVPHDGDKIAASERTYTAGGIDVSDTLRKFARMCALDVIHLWDPPEVVIKYLKSGDESIRAAAWAAAWAAAAAAAATTPAAWAAAWGAAWDAARDAQNRRLTRMINTAIRARVA